MIKKKIKITNASMPARFKSLWDYNSVLALTPKKPHRLILNGVAVGILESVLMFSIYPVIAVGLNERTPRINSWIATCAESGFSQNTVIILHILGFLILGSISSSARWYGEARLLSYRNLMEQSLRSKLAYKLTLLKWEKFLTLGGYSSTYQIAASSDKVAEGAYNAVVSTSLLICSAIMAMSLFAISPSFTLSAVALLTM